MSETVGTENAHRVTLIGCQTLALTGVREVISFDECSVLFQTTCGQMTVEGEGLHVSRLDLDRGEADIAGAVTGLYYSKVRERGNGFFRRARD